MYAQTEMSFANQKHEQIYGLLPQNTREIIQEKRNSMGDIIIDAQIHDSIYKLRVGFESTSSINQIGLKIYDRENIDLSASDVAFFVERILLEYLLCMEKEDFFKCYEKEKILFKLNGISTLYHLEKLLTLENALPFQVQIDSNQIYIHLPFSPLNVLEITVPNEIGVLKAMDKAELESQLIKELQVNSKQALKKVNIKEASFKTYKAHIFLLRGSFFNKDSLINSHTFYTKDGFGYKPLDNPNYKKETFNNIFQLLISSNQMIQVRPMLYNESSPLIEMNLTDFVSFFYDDYEIYLGWQKETAEKLTGSLFLKHKYYNHKHLLEFINTKNTQASEASSIQGKLYLFIPNEQL